MADAAQNPPLLRVSDLHHAYGDRPVLAGVSLRLHAGERVALTGPSGSGKTTLLNLLGGVDRPRSGRIEFDGVCLNELDGDGLADLRRRSFGTIFQFFHLLPTLTAAENVELPLQLLGIPTRERLDRVAHLMERVGVAHRAEAPPGELSGGEMQRVAIARALAGSPALLLADEPTGNLDSANAALVCETFSKIASQKIATLIIVTHSDSVAALAPVRIQMIDGTILSKHVINYSA